jgi:tRNA-dihydrouridine synthase B
MPCPSVALLWQTPGKYEPAGSFDERLSLMLFQYSFLEERFGPERGLVLFRKMAHWYLKGMRVRKKLRGEFQSVCTLQDLAEIMERIRTEGPVDGNRTGVLSDVEIAVPRGPVDKW